MNTLNLQLPSTSRFDASRFRAQLSPLLRRPSLSARVQNRDVAMSLSRTVSTVSTNPAPLTPATPSLTDRWWDPHLLDRLQTPLTRYHE